jgi:glycosyltransferase involved in cell wall biosynthesis
MTIPKITIVTPSFNQGKFLRQTIESILAQNYPHLEYFIIDGGSTDESLDIIREYEDQISWWVSETDRGQTDAINKGFKRATGELCAWVNSDDVLLPNCLQKVADCYQKYNQPDLIYGNCIYIDNDSRITRMVRVPRQTLFWANRGVLFTLQPALFYKTDTIKKVGYLNPDYSLAMDIDLWMKMIKVGLTIEHIPQYMGGFRWHGESKSTQSNQLKKDKSDEDKESKGILDAASPNISQSQRKFWRLVWKSYQLLNLNYLRSFQETFMLKGKNWQDYC